ncbi:DUF6888 family protein [Microcoleus sp. LAD1_D3]|uniref:DUF6888 family protein n=1 Tax=Microcoleus sp. LAD1_D3 TaxID=2819365 RepID=UPI0040409FE2
MNYYLTYLALQPLHLICVDERTHNLFVLAGSDEDIEVKISPNRDFFKMIKVGYIAIFDIALKRLFIKTRRNKAARPA